MSATTTTPTPRPEYPRPQFVRADWLNLNGPWAFAYDDANEGERQGWWKESTVAAFDRTIVVPFAYQSQLSGIGETAFHDVVWYRRSFDLPSEWTGRDLLLHFGAVDYAAKVWVNGCLAGGHEGGHTPFHVDITGLVRPGANVVVVRAEDPSADMTLPRGKQYWEENSKSIWYTRTTGIWQTVWLEPVSPSRIERVRMTPDLDAVALDLDAYVTAFKPGMRLRVEISIGGEFVAEEEYRLQERRLRRRIGFPDPEHRMMRLWWPERPRLHDVRFTLLDAQGAPVDQVDSYFGYRKVHVEGGRFYLNNRPYYQKLVLDQGYWPESLLTPPSDEALQKDIELTKALGFNGVRKHQKVEDPRYLYWADKLGLFVWGEMANAYHYSEEYAAKMTREWIEVIERDYNHPCIVTWTPLNESWGVPRLSGNQREVEHQVAMYHLTRSLDTSRPISSNDGWELAKTDLFTVHDYSPKREMLMERYGGDPAAVADLLPAGRKLFVGGYGYTGQPLLITEFGGIAFKKSDWEGWGYSGAENEEEFVSRYREVVEALFDCPNVVGWCYTQLTDVEQEINGLLTYDRVPKVDPAIIKKINRS
jgi:beta-galactosidase/beta-glucuronidase